MLLHCEHYAVTVQIGLWGKLQISEIKSKIPITLTCLVQKLWNLNDLKVFSLLCFCNCQFKQSFIVVNIYKSNKDCILFIIDKTIIELNVLHVSTFICIYQLMSDLMQLKQETIYIYIFWIEVQFCSLLLVGEI